MSVASMQKRLAALEAQRDAMFKHLAKNYDKLDYEAILTQDKQIKAVARQISAAKAAITRAKNGAQ